MFKNLEKVKKQQQFDKFLTSNFFVCRIRNISYESGSNPCFVGSKTFFRFTYIVVLLCLLIFLYCILLFIIFISSTRRRGTICVAETSPQTGLTLAMMLSWGKACSTVPSGPLPPPPLTYQLGRIQGGGGNGAIAHLPPHIPPPPLTVKSLFETTILWHMFLKINISQIFLSKVCDFIYLELEKLNLTPTPLIWILNLLALQPIPPPPFL